jgi:CBS domain-containing protein
VVRRLHLVQGNMKRVEDLMSRAVISLKPTDTIDVAKLDMDIAAIRHVPVVDAHNRVVGIVALADVLAAFTRAPDRPVPIANVMQTEVVTIHRKMPAYDAVRTMLERKIGALPVLGDREEIVGILTETDLLRVAEEALRRAA